MRGLRAFYIATLVFAGGSLSGAEVGEPSAIASHPMIGEQAPPFVLEEVNGGTISLDSLKGRYSVIHFGTSW